MAVLLAAILVVSYVRAQEHGTALSTIQPSSPPLPLLDLFPGASSYIPDSIRKTYSDPGYSHTICPTYKSDALSSFASILGSASKIMLAATAITFLKVIAGKLLLLPFMIMLFTKMGIKTLLLWPIIAKLMKYFKRKKRNGATSRALADCTERVACVMRHSVLEGWGSNFGTAAVFSVIDSFEVDSGYSSVLLNILAGEKVAKCMDIVCSEGIDVS